MKRYGLTDREISIIDFLMKRKSNLEIAESLFISEKTVKTHVSNIIRKMNVKNRIDVMLICQELDAEEIKR
ncbi:helix-turn-helix transcriptional regulator [Muricomes sp. OA1]|nr:helix-turn-helix transcriptional regulator [Muricomes sp. OA1]